MDFDALVRRLSAVDEPDGGVVTLGLDVSKSGILPPATRVFLKDRVYGNLDSEARPERLRAALRRISRRIRKLVESGLREGSDGLYLVAGARSWEAVELGVPLPNFVEVGRGAFLAPLLAAERAHPRAWLVEATPEEAAIVELHLGERREAERVVARPPVDDLEKASARRSGRQNSGGAERDLQQRRRVESIRAMLREAARRVGQLHREAPGLAVYLAGDRESFEEFRAHLPAALRPLAEPLGARRDAERRAKAAVARAVAERSARELAELKEARSLGLRAALGPREVLERLSSGEVDRVYLDPTDPLPGVLCMACGSRFPGLQARCPYCEGEVRGASLTQEIVAGALRKPKPDLAFVTPSAPWLARMGGLAGLLTGARA